MFRRALWLWEGESDDNNGLLTFRPIWNKVLSIAVMHYVCYVHYSITRASSQKRWGRQDDCPGRHWGRWRLPSTSPVTTKAIILTTFPLKWLRLKSPTTRVFVQRYLSDKHRRKRHPILEGNHRWQVFPQTKVPVIRKVFQWTYGMSMAWFDIIHEISMCLSSLYIEIAWQCFIIFIQMR